MGGTGAGSADGGIVGRSDELALLDRVLGQAVDGRLGLVLVEGEGGIGKTRLVHGFTAAAAGAGVRVMAGACLELGTTIPYLPFAEMLRDLVRDLPDAERAALLGPGSDVLGPLLRPDDTPRAPALPRDEPAREMSGELARLAMFESLLRITERLVERRPLLVVLEDIQWADRATLDLVTFLARNLRGARIMLVMTARTGGRAPEPVAAFIASLERNHRVERIDLGPLDVEETAHQLAGILGRPADPDLVRDIHRRSGGNPLFAEELLAWTLSGTGRGVTASPRLRDMVADRVGQLPAEAHGVLRLASAAGRIVDDDLLIAASGLPAPTVSAGIRAAVAQGLLVPAMLEGREGYAFRHDLVREAVAAELLPGERARLHEAFALALTSGRTRVVDHGELAYHWDAAGEHAKALAAHIDAGLAARDVFAFETAHEHLERALALWPRVPAADDMTMLDRVDLVIATADAAAMAGDHERAVELERMLLAELGPGTTDERAILARERLRRSLWESGDTAGALVEAEAAVRIIGPAPSRARASVLGHLAALLLFTGNVRRARVVAGEAFQIASALGERSEAALAVGVMGWSLMYAGRVEASLAMIRAGADTAEQMGEPYGRALAADHLARALEMAGRAGEAAEVALAGTDLCRRQGLGRTYGALLAADGARCLRVLGRIEQAAELAGNGLAAGPVGPGQTALLAAAAMVAVERDEIDAARAAITDAADLAGPSGDLDSAGWLAAARASISLRRGQPEEALATLRGLTGVGGQDGMRAVTPASRGASLVQLGASVGPLLRLAGRAIADIALLERARGSAASGSGPTAAGSVSPTAAGSVSPTAAGSVSPTTGSGHTVAGIVPATTLAADRARLGNLLRWFLPRQELAAALATDLALATAELARADGPASDAAATAWRHALDVDRSRPSPSPASQAYACLRLGEALAIGRDRDEATTVVRDGLGIARAHGLVALEADLALLARRARLPVAADAAAGGAVGPGGEVGVAETENPFGLTEREVEVLRLVAAGLTNREIGERLFISPKTASVHVSSILAKLGVPGRLDAALVAQQVGLYEPVAAAE